MKDTDMLLCAFVHKSYASDFKEEYNHNERLEFVGDAVLGSVIAKALFLNFPTMQESNMTLYKIGLVREETLAKVAQKIKLNTHIFISKGEEKNHGRLKASIISDALEALI
jgi:ribonuclease III